VPSILNSIQTSLTPLVSAAGFQRSDRALWKDLAWIEYRRQDADGIIMLGIVWIPAEGTITAEVWRPDRLATSARTGVPEGAIEWQQAWHCNPDDDTSARAREVAAGIIAHLTASEPNP
jgi:hypothetical protein